MTRIENLRALVKQFVQAWKYEISVPFCAVLPGHVQLNREELPYCVWVLIPIYQVSVP